MTKRKSLLDNIFVFSCVVFTAVAIVVGLILFLIQPEELCNLFTSPHTVGLFCFAAGAVIACIITRYVLRRWYCKKLESKNKLIRRLLSEKKQLEHRIQNMPLAEEKNNFSDTQSTKPKNIIGEIEGLSETQDLPKAVLDKVESDEHKDDFKTQDKPADES